MSWWLYVVLGLYLLQGLFVILKEFRYPAKTVAWLLVLFIFPIVGFVMYLVLARPFAHIRNRKNEKAAPAERSASRIRGNQLEQPFRLALPELATEFGALPLDTKDEAGLSSPLAKLDPRLLRLLDRLPRSRPVPGNRIEVLTNAQDTYPSILAALERAKDHIHLEYYTIRHDAIGRTFRDMLIRKAREGVRVRVLADGIGSFMLDRAYRVQLQEAGIEFRLFLPPFQALATAKLNYRNHRKTVVVDGKIGFLGGINIGDEYLGGNPKLGFWRDTHLRLEGAAVHDLQKTFLIDWAYAGKEPAEQSERYYPRIKAPGSEWVQIVASGPDGVADPVLESVIAAIGSARRRIAIATPYFIPDQSLFMALKVAALSGVEVTLLLPGIPDSKIVYRATMSHVKEMLQTGIRVYRYQKGFLHAKVMVVDDSYASVGTANMDLRSFFRNFELNAILYGRGAMERLMQDFEADLQDSEELTYGQFVDRPPLTKAAEVACRILSPLF